MLKYEGLLSNSMILFTLICAIALLCDVEEVAGNASTDDGDVSLKTPTATP